MKALSVVLALTACSHARAVPSCTPGVGLSAPLSTCSKDAPCEGAMDFARGKLKHTITDATDPVRCATSNASKRPRADDGAPLQLAGIDGTPRAACVHHPSAPGKKPLVLLLHGAGGNIQGLYDHTSMRAKSDAVGFVLAMPQGRNLHWPSVTPGGPHWDHYFRDGERNPDVRFFDALIDALVAQGDVDPSRIYVVGWSNGGRMAQFYGLLRHSHATAGGNRVAAVASYAGASPFAAPSAEASTCAMEVAKSDLPVLLLNRDCDGAMACDAQQAASFELPPGSDMSGWKAQLTAADPNVTLQLYDGDGRPSSACASRCHRLGGLINHVRWPDGIDDESGRDHELELLQFLRDHPLSPRE